MKLFIGVCNSQQTVLSNFFWSVFTMRQPCPVMASRSNHPWDVIRNNRLIKKFLDSDCDCFAKMDVDQAYPCDYLEKMVPRIEQYKVIGPLIFDRWEQNDYFPLLFSEVKPGNELIPFDMAEKIGIVEVPYAHTNLFYHREVLEAIKPPWYEAYLTEDGLNRANHVDFTFIQKLKDAGYKIYIDLDMVVEHRAEVGINKEFYQKWHNQV